MKTNFENIFRTGVAFAFIAFAGYCAGRITEQMNYRDRREIVSMFDPQRGSGGYIPPVYTYEGKFPATEVPFKAEKIRDFFGGETLTIPAEAIPGNLTSYKQVVAQMIDLYLQQNPFDERREELLALKNNIPNPDVFHLRRTDWWGGWGTQTVHIGKVLTVSYNEDCTLKWVTARSGDTRLEYFDQKAALYFEKRSDGLEIKDFRGSPGQQRLEDHLRETMGWIRTVNGRGYPKELCGI